MTTKFKGNEVHLDGTFIPLGTTAPQVELTKNDLSAFTLDEHRGKYVVLNIFPSIDTGVCAASQEQKFLLRLHRSPLEGQEKPPPE